MRTICHSCQCRTCLNVCGKCTDCKGKIESCMNYNGFWQENIFDIPQEPKYHGTPRHTLEYYGLTDERVEELKKYIRYGEKYIIPIASQAAYKADKMIYGHILLSIKRNLSYEGLEKLWGRGEIERIPYGRTDFYGIRRYFYSLFDKELRRIGK